MHKTPDVTLHVYQILEEEYVAQHGSIDPAPFPFRMPTGDGGGLRDVEANLGWDFGLGHIKDPSDFVAELLGEGGPSPAAASGDAKGGGRAVREYVVGLLGREFLEKLAPSLTGAREGVGRLEEKLNDVVLKDRGLYSEERFPCESLRVSTVELLQQLRPGACPGRRLSDGPPAAGGGAAADASPESDRWWARLNRLLLEDAFPRHLLHAYDIRLAAMFRRLHDADQSALCLSGGGIRSGTFALGLLQGLARHDLLERFDYLSTVSGGGYVGSWLTAWLHRHPEGLRGVARELKNSAPASRIDPDPKAIQNLREYSNFITPKAGLLTADTWAFAGIYLRNLLLNWLVFIPLLAAVLTLPRLMLNVTLMQPTGGPVPVAASAGDATGAALLASVPEGRRVRYEPAPLVPNFFGRLAGLPVLGRVWVSLFGEGRHLYWRHLLLLPGYAFGVWALGFVIFNRPGMRGLLKRRNPRWYGRADQRSFLKYCLTPLLVSAALLTVYWAWSQEGADVTREVVSFVIFGALFTGGAKLVARYVLRERGPEGGAAEAGAAVPEMKARGGARASGWWLAVGAAATVAGLLFWLVSLFPIGDPVVGYGASVRDGRVVRAPFAWTDWTGWAWWDSWTTELYVCAGVPIFLLIYWASLTTYVGISSADQSIDDEDREWWARFGAWLLIAALGWLVLTALVIFGPLALLESPKLLASVGGLSGLLAVLLGRSSKTPAGGEGGEAGKKGSKAAGLLFGLLPLFGAVFLGAFVALVSLGLTGLTRQLVLTAGAFAPRALPAAGAAGAADAPPGGGLRESAVQALTNVPLDAEGGAWVGPNRGFDDYVRHVTPVVPTLVRPAPTPRPGATPCQPVCVGGLDEKGDAGPEVADSFRGAQIVHLNVLHHTSVWLTLALGGLLFLTGRFLSRKVNLNVFSLHGGYRNRLIRAFLGASRPPRERRPNPFTGFDPADNIHMHELRWALFDEGDFLAPGELAKRLREGTDPLSNYLRNKGLVDNALREAAEADAPRRVETLRSDLNGVLQRERLYVDFARYLETERGRRTRDEIRRAFRQPPADDSAEDVQFGDYHFLLNRLVLEEAYPGMLRPGPPPPYRLLHVVNTSLNLVGGDKLAWQQRKAEPFSVSPLHAGCFRLGYRRSRDYGGSETGGISIGTAAAISGAAASSNMGYYTTSPVISLLLTLFNVRLGWWLGNPGPAGAHTYRSYRPESAVTPILHEAFGLTNDRYKYVYLTDGGHFENLAVYEMVLRRCRFVVVADGAQDEEYRFGDLGNAVRKIRIDLGVPIDFPCIAIYGREEADKRGPGMYWAIGRIRYSCVDGTPKADDGLLLYIKPAVYGDEPRDVVEYKSSFPAFPHQSTGDQFFDEPQFESYRALGSHIMERLCGGGGKDPERLDFAQVVARARAEMLKHCPNPDADFAEWLGRLAGDGGDAGPAAGLNPS